MGLYEDAYEAIESGYSMTVAASPGTGYDTGTTIRYVLYPQSNSTVSVTTNVSTNVSAYVTVSGDNITPVQSVSIEDTDVITIEIPPAAEQVEIVFIFNGIGFDLSSGPLGSLTFNDIKINDSVVQGDLLKFSVNNGIRILNHQYALYSSEAEILNEPSALKVENYPIYGDTENILSAKSGVITKRGNLNLGTY